MPTARNDGCSKYLASLRGLCPKQSRENVIFPEISIDPEYNPFNSQNPEAAGGSYTKPSPGEKKNLEHWEDLYEGVQLKIKPEEQSDPA